MFAPEPVSLGLQQNLSPQSHNVRPVSAFEVNEFRVRFLTHMMSLHLFALLCCLISFLFRGHGHGHFKVAIILSVSINRANPAGAAVEAPCDRG